jgi:hemerythrin superfamily protein
MGTVRTNSNATLNVLDILTSQHREVDELFAKLEAHKGDRNALVLELADKLAAHATAEEKIFYPSVMARQTADLLHESVEEHLEIKRLLADIITQRLDGDELTAKLSVLKENVTHHAHEEEEQKLFPMLRSSLGADVLAGLGNEVLAMFEDLMPTHPSRHLAAETAHAAPLPPVA